MQDTVHVRIISPITTTGFRPDGDVKSLEGPGLIISATQISRGPGSIESEYEGAMAAPDTIAKIVEAERQGVDACVIDCMGDPGLKPSREAVTIPVLGPCNTSMHVAAMLGHKFSVITVMHRLLAQFENAAALAGLSSRMASARSVDIPVLELEKDMATTRAALIEEARKAVELDGAHAVIFGCTGLFGCAAAVRDGLLRHGIDVPVIDPIPTTVNTAAALVRSRLSHSAHTYPLPPVKAMPGYDMPDLHKTAAE
ncbi:aspartate/glutamate racemase family protein [Labrenzia sp. 011]|uniref:aspartate/glutamate racemase family protein n=1 Tax=Labrenzia sp. 011 TaxID=2171494 RepID=UPI000D50F17C|nr:aspartate/glutamate racemase family protein [Labrenzia sp. 011]PVB60640.1 hydrogenase expression protein HupH [Labrenzia sp. 011]